MVCVLPLHLARRELIGSALFFECRRRREPDDVVGGIESGAYQHRRGNRPKGRPGSVSSQLLAQFYPEAGPQMTDQR
jgi:hypothetical protein